MSLLVSTRPRIYRPLLLGFAQYAVSDAPVKKKAHTHHVDKDTCFTNYTSITSRAFATSLILEFVGTALFTFLGSVVDDKVLGPFVNGLALTVVIYMAANISGGHINPAVTFSTLICGFYPLLHALLYIFLQIVGAIAGAAMVAGLSPNHVYVGMGDGAPGCFDHGTSKMRITKGQIFGWEVVMTFTLISTVYACGIAKPGHGSMTPVAVGFSLIACAGAGAKYTGAALNPARVIGPLAIFKCGKDVAWIYILAELLAAVLACSIFAVVSGWGPLFPVKAMQTFNMTWHEAVGLFLTGRPPKRFRTGDDDNVNDLQPLNFIGRGISSLKGWTSSRKSLDNGASSPPQSFTNTDASGSGAAAAADKLPV